MKDNRFFKGLSAFLPHLLMTFGLMLLTFYCITLVNESMGFLSSYFSQKFEVLYVIVAVLTAVTAFVLKRGRALAAILVLCAVAMLIPVIICIAQHRMDLLDEKWFQWIALANGIISVAFAVVLIVLQRKASRAAWRAQQIVSGS